MLSYNDINDDIKPFVPFDEQSFNILSDVAKETLLEGARVQWLKAGAPKRDSIMYSINNDSHYITDINDLTDYYYEHYRKETTMGIDNYRFSLRSILIKPSLSQFIDICMHQSISLNATNAVVSYIDNDDMIHHLSFSNNDLKTRSVHELFNMLKIGAEHWHDNDLYVGSDIVRDGFKTYRLNIDHFEIVVKHTRGGYGKMIAHFYDTLGLENNEDDCLIHCFIHIHNKEHYKMDINVNEIRSLLFKEGKLGIDAVPLLEHLFNVKVAVCQDYHNIDIQYEGPETISMKSLPPYTAFNAIITKDDEVFIYGDKTCKWKLLYKNEHYDVVTRSYDASECICKHTGELLPRRKPFSKKILRRKIIERYYIDAENLTTGADSDTEDDKDVYYYFFDYETVFEVDTMEIIPYAYAIVKCDAKFNIIEERYKIGLDCNKDLSNYLFNESPDKNHEIKYLIGYNNSRFDNFILLKEAIKYNDYIGHTRFNGNSIISANVNDFKVRDLCRILNMSLDNACKAFNISMPKLTGAVSHHEVQFFFMNNKDKFSDYLGHYHKNIKDYVIRDCVSLSQLCKITKHTMMNLVNLNLNDHYTLAGMSYAAFRSTINIKELPILNNNYTDKDKFVRKAIIGGRSQMKLTKGTNMCAIDCVSLYPYVMLNRYYPIGLPKSTNYYMNDKIGVYMCVVKKQPINSLNIIPLRNDNGRLNWNYKNNIECVLCSVDIECLRRHGIEVNVGYGIYWEKSRNNIFDHYFNNLIDEKKNQDKLKESDKYNPAIRETCKLLMNSLSGKLAQRIYNTETEIIRNARDVDRFFNKTIPGTQKLVPFGSKFIAQGKKEGVPNTPVIYGVLIYAYAREHMYESVLKYLNVDELYGMDTDSAFITKEIMQRMPKHIFGSDFGQFKLELNNMNGIFIAPKCYCFHKDDKIVKARFKGIKIGNDIEEDGNCDLNNIFSMYHYYHTKKEKVDLNTFNKLFDNGKIRIMCCNINKSIVSSSTKLSLYLSNHIFVKDIIVKDDELCILSNNDNIIIDC